MSPDPTRPNRMDGGTASGTATPHDGNGAHDEAPQDVLRQLGAHFAEFKEYASYYLAAKMDGIKLAVRNVAIYAVLGIVGLVAAGALLVTAVVLFFTGIAQAVSALAGGRAWVGNLTIGFVLLALIGGGTMFMLSKMFGGSKRRTREKYEQLKQRQRVRFGTDVSQRSQEHEHS